MKKTRREKADDQLLHDIDAALELVGGRSFPAAAKLLDIEPRRFRNLVNSRHWLKAKWGRKTLGKPKSVGFELLRIKPFAAPAPRLQAVSLIHIKSFLASHLLSPELDDLAVWLEWLRKQRAGNDTPLVIDGQSKAA